MSTLPPTGRHLGAQACLYCHYSPWWMAAPAPKASLVLGKVSEVRKNVLRDRALLVIRLTSAPFDQHGQFRRLLEADPHDQRLLDAVWYCDGSMLNGRWKALRATGFGIAVVAISGDLLAYGLGCPPLVRALKPGQFRSSSPCARLRRRSALIACLSSQLRWRGPRRPRTTPDRWPESGAALRMHLETTWLPWCLSKILCGFLPTSLPLP